MRKVLFSVFISASLLCTTTFASVNDDQVTSQKIKEADGTSGQNTNGGSGVKTGHIQNGAVTDAKISGVISATKLPVGTTAGTVASGDHNHDGLYQKKYANVVVVAKSGGDFSDPIAAVNSISDASAANPYLVKIMPGVYDFGSSYLCMKPYVDIEGAGKNATILSASGGEFLPTVLGASNAELRLLSVTHSSEGTATAIVISNASIQITDVAVQVFGGGRES